MTWHHENKEEEDDRIKIEGKSLLHDFKMRKDSRQSQAFLFAQETEVMVQRVLIDSGHLALLSPSCRLPVASLSLFRHFQPPVAPLSLACRFPVAVLPLPCRSPVASLSLSCRPPVASLSLPVASCRFLSPCYFLPGAFLSLSCRSPVVPSCRSPVAISCCLPVGLLSLACRLPAASLSPPCRLPVASLSPNVVTYRSPVACLSLACRLPVVFLPPPCRLPIASLSPPCRPTW